MPVGRVGRRGRLPRRRPPLRREPRRRLRLGARHSGWRCRRRGEVGRVPIRCRHPDGTKSTSPTPSRAIRAASRCSTSRDSGRSGGRGGDNEVQSRRRSRRTGDALCANFRSWNVSVVERSASDRVATTPASRGVRAGRGQSERCLRLRHHSRRPLEIVDTAIHQVVSGCRGPPPFGIATTRTAVWASSPTSATAP